MEIGTCNTTPPSVFKDLPKTDIPGIDHFDEHHLIIPLGHWVSQEMPKELPKF